MHTKPYLVRRAAVMLIMGAGMTAAASGQFINETREVTRRGTAAAELLSIPVGARATAMGGAIAASVGDASAMYWNPAGLGGLERPTFMAEQASWLADINYNYAAVALPTRLGTFGLAVTSMRTQDMRVTRVAAQEGTGETFNAASYALATSWGKALTDKFSFGATAKLANERIRHSRASGLALDIGTVFVTPFRGIRLSASMANFGTKMQATGDDLLVVSDIDPNNRGNNDSNRALLKTDRFDMPLIVRVGLAGEAVEHEEMRITLAVDVLSPNNSNQYANIGAEFGFLGDLLMLRAGYSELFLGESIRSFSLGGGLRFDFSAVGLAMDYACEHEEYFSGVSRFTLAAHF